MPYILNVWEDRRRGLLTVHLYRANAAQVIVLATVPEALDLLADMGETEVWSFNEAGHLGLYSLDPAEPEANIGPDFPLPRIDFEEAPEPSRRTPADLALVEPPFYQDPPGAPAAPRPLRKRPFLRIVKRLANNNRG